jgi:type I restriction enzyme S subunit
MSFEWRNIAFGDFIALQRGHDLPDQDRRPGIVPILGSFGVTGFHDTVKAKAPGVTVGRSGASFGVAAYTEKDYWPLNTALYITDFKDNDPKFVFYFLKLFDFSGYNSGSAQPSLNRNNLYGIPIRVPPKPTQKHIADFISALDDNITLLRETNATLEAIAQAMFKSWFVDFDPVHAKQQGRAPEGMDEATAALFPDSFEESELGLVPMGWEHVSLKEVVSIFDSRRIPIAGQERAKKKGPHPYYGAAALMDYVDDYLFDGVYLLTGEDGSVADELGYPITQYVWGKIWVNNHAHVLQGKDGVSTEHLMLFLRRTNIQPYITGAVQAKLSQSNMWRIMFLKPSRPMSECFGKLIAPLYTRLRHNSEQAQTLATLRDTLLPRLISGQLRLPAAEAQLEEAVA